jgi:hypothetical protein
MKSSIFFKEDILLTTGRLPHDRSSLENANFRPEFIDIPGSRKSQLVFEVLRVTHHGKLAGNLGIGNAIESPGQAFRRLSP